MLRLQLVLDIDKPEERRVECWAHNGDMYCGPTLNRFRSQHEGKSVDFWTASCWGRGYDGRHGGSSCADQIRQHIAVLQEMVDFIDSIESREAHE